MDGKKLQLPPVVTAQYGESPDKKTILVYGHYDVQPALLEDGEQPLRVDSRVMRDRS